MIKYIKRVFWRVAKRLSYIQDARCLKVNANKITHHANADICSKEPCRPLIGRRLPFDPYQKPSFQNCYVPYGKLRLSPGIICVGWQPRRQPRTFQLSTKMSLKVQIFVIFSALNSLSRYLHNCYSSTFTSQWSLYVPHSGHYMYHQFNIQQFYVLPTHYLCVLCGSQNKQRLFPYTALTDWFV